jgi:pimeloyl-ACP methyl ester carboxylesterase
MRVQSPVDLSQADKETLQGHISCPTLLAYRVQSWASNPEDDDPLKHFINARVSLYGAAGHWMHHDQHDDFLNEIERFLS